MTLKKILFIFFLINIILFKNSFSSENDIYKKILRLSLKFYSEKKRGDLVARISSDVQELENSFLSIFELFRLKKKKKKKKKWP